MYGILVKKDLTPVTRLYEVRAPAVARKARPGQFVIVRIHDKGERIPLTVADYDRERGTINLVVQEVGKTTLEMGTIDCQSQPDHGRWHRHVRRLSCGGGRHNALCLRRRP